jgi:hypothetical protein
LGNEKNPTTKGKLWNFRGLLTTEDDKFNRVDLLAKNENNQLILIEVQHSSEIDYFHRMLFGVSKLITMLMDLRFYRK